MGTSWEAEIMGIVSRRAIEGVDTWGRINRRLPGKAPGYKFQGSFNVYVVMDLTCSFDPRTYYEVFNTLREIVDSECWMGGCNTIALLWYGETVEKIEDDKMLLEKLSSTAKNNGGERNEKHLLEYLSDIIGNNDIVVIMSDGELLDKINQVTEDLLFELEYMTKYTVYLTSGKKPQALRLFNWSIVSL